MNLVRRLALATIAATAFLGCSSSDAPTTTADAGGHDSLAQEAAICTTPAHDTAAAHTRTGDRPQNRRRRQWTSRAGR